VEVEEQRFRRVALLNAHGHGGDGNLLRCAVPAASETMIRRGKFAPVNSEPTRHGQKPRCGTNSEGRSLDSKSGAKSRLDPGS
jgi:hypothetical protein